MPIHDIFSKRKMRQNGLPSDDVYKYDSMPGPLRIQIVYIFRSLFGTEGDTHVDEFFHAIAQALCREYGVFTLGRNASAYGLERIGRFMTEDATTDQCIDVIDMVPKARELLPRPRHGKCEPCHRK
jgi:hypothetical protein